MCDSIENSACDFRSLCGGRKFTRKFDKKYYPLLGDDDEEEKEQIRLRGISSMMKSQDPSFESQPSIKKCHSTTFTKLQDLCRDPNTGRWRWPVNGADLVYPGIYLGDE